MASINSRTSFIRKATAQYTQSVARHRLRHCQPAYSRAHHIYMSPLHSPPKACDEPRSKRPTLTSRGVDAERIARRLSDKAAAASVVASSQPSAACTWAVPLAPPPPHSSSRAAQREASERRAGTAPPRASGQRPFIVRLLHTALRSIVPHPPALRYLVPSPPWEPAMGRAAGRGWPAGSG